MNLPDYNFLSAPLWLITILHIVTLTLHLIAMNFLFGSLLTILFAKINDKWNDPTVKKLVNLFPNLMAATVSLGVAPLLFVQLVYSKQIYTASIVSGWLWLMIFMVAMLSYYLLYSASFSKLPGKGNRLVYLSLAVSGFFYISFVYSSVFSMAEFPDVYKTLYASNQSGLALNTEIGAYIFRWLHMVLGAITVGSFFVSWLGKDNQPLYEAVKKIFIFGMIATMVIGFVYLVTLGEMMLQLMRSPAIWLITAGLILSLGALHFYTKKKFNTAALMLFPSMLFMIITRHLLRLMRLEETFDPATIPVSTNWPVFIIFLVCFLFAIGIIWYMFKLYYSKEQA